MSRLIEAAQRYRTACAQHHEASMTQRAGFDATHLFALADEERAAAAALLQAAKDPD